MATSRKKAPAKKETPVESTDLVAMAAAEVPDYIKQDASRGNENITQDDLVIPRLSLIQSISPERKKTDPAYIEGAEEGMMFNTVTRKLYTTATVVPVTYEKLFLAWRDRKLGGGFAGAHRTAEEANAAILAEEQTDGWEVQDTPTQLCILIDEDGTLSEIAIPMSRSKAKISKRWNSVIRVMGGDRFSRAYTVTSVEDSNDQGQDYFNFSIVPKGFAPQDAYMVAEKLYEDLMSGDRVVDLGKEEAGEEDNTTTGTAYEGEDSEI